MSGGSYDYAYMKLEEFADQLRNKSCCADDSDPALRELFREHVRRVARAMRAIEWNDSCDGDSAEKQLILECLKPELCASSIALLESRLAEVENVCRSVRLLLAEGKTG